MKNWTSVYTEIIKRCLSGWIQELTRITFLYSTEANTESFIKHKR